MAVNRLEFLRSSSVDITNGTTTIIVRGSVDCSTVFQGTTVQINNNQIVEAVSGTGFDPVTGESSIELRYNWEDPTVTAGKLIGFNSIEGLNSAVTRLNQIINSIPDFSGASGQGLLYNNGNDVYTIKILSSTGESLIAAADPAAARAILELPDLNQIAAQDGVVRKNPSNVYSTIASQAYGESLLNTADSSSALSVLQAPDFPSLSALQGALIKDSLNNYSVSPTESYGLSLLNTADAASARAALSIIDPSDFGETLITQADAATARGVLGVVSATEVSEGLIRKSTTSEAKSGVDDNSSMTPLRVREAYGQYGLGVNAPEIGSNTLLTVPVGSIVGFSGTKSDAIAKGFPDPAPIQPGSLSVYFTCLTIGDESLAVKTQICFEVLDSSFIQFTQSRMWVRDIQGGGVSDWGFVSNTTNKDYFQNNSGATIPSNTTTQGSSLNPPKSGTWLNVSGIDISNGGYGTFRREV